MFKSEIRIKSNNQMKRTEIKVLRDSISRMYPMLTEQDLNIIFSKKDRINILKLEIGTTKQNTGNVVAYTSQSSANPIPIPIFFECNSFVLPTVFLLWKFPNLLIPITAGEPVFSYISSGADLMMPGVKVPRTGYYEPFPTNQYVYVNLTTNKAAVAVGTTVKSSAEMMSDRKGKSVTILHYYGDRLCVLIDCYRVPCIPTYGPPDFLIPNGIEISALSAYVPNSHTETSVPEVSSNVENTDSSTLPLKLDSASMDELLIHCFLTVLKYSKNLSLPVLTSNFYKQMITVCPTGKTLDVKKSTYKKVGNFIHEMSQLGLISTKEDKKGVELITEYNEQHELFIDFYLEKSERPITTSVEATTIGKKILEGYIVTPCCVRFFQNFRLQKGHSVQAAEVRKYVTMFVKEHNLQDQENKSVVHLNDVLADLCKTKDSLTWEELMEKVFKSMKPYYAVSTDNQQGPVIKGKVQPITMVISNRSGNKKVTLVDNLELYGIPIQKFAKQCQHGVAASTSVLNVPGKKSQQLLVQGNQIHFIHKLLKDEYKIPQHYMRGLEFAVKKK